VTCQWCQRELPSSGLPMVWQSSHSTLYRWDDRLHLVSKLAKTVAVENQPEFEAGEFEAVA
jgi:hypothetical protein